MIDTCAAARQAELLRPMTAHPEYLDSGAGRVAADGADQGRAVARGRQSHVEEQHVRPANDALAPGADVIEITRETAVAASPQGAPVVQWPPPQ